MHDFEAIKQGFLDALNQCQTDAQMADLKAEYLGKTGVLTELMKLMKDLPAAEKPKHGAQVNAVKVFIESELYQYKERLYQEKLEKKMESEKIDITLPGVYPSLGVRHLLSQIVEEIEDLFVGLGYQVKEGPEIETDENNFEKLNLPAGHPARDMQDSFYIDAHTLLRTHTSPVQVRTMLEMGGKKPVKIICPGKVYRRDDDDATHSHQFMQIEGLVVDEKTSMSDLKGTLLKMAQAMFGEDRTIRLRPSYFPFTEPSVEVDVSCYQCQGHGCSMCKQTGYIEILGAGMVHPNVLKMSGYDPEKYQGFAFGIGVERIAMLRHGIEDIRHFYTNDIRFLSQFKR
jgi:phenylalanyl-tRNA synthetase alpha chain